MKDRHFRIGTCVFLALLAAAPVHAQEPSWGLRVFAEGGGHFPRRNLGKNAVDIAQQSALQVIGQVEDSPTLGGGLEFLFPDGTVRIRGQFMTTVGATARGVLGLCESGELAVPGEGLCALDLAVDARVMDGTAELVFLAGDPDRWVRPTISFGVGVRSFDFASASLDCSGFNQTTDEYQVCSKSREILEDPSVNPSLTLGVGLEVDKDPLAIFVRLRMVTASYTGGSGLADGGRQVDPALTAGLALRVR